MTQEKPPTESANNIILDPFKTVYDVTPQTPVDDIPQEYWKGCKQQLRDEREEAERLKAAVEAFSVNPDNEELLLEQAHTTISRFDDHIIRAVFHTGLSAYYKPLNLGLKAESGSGKTYSTVETIKFLPDEDVQFIGSQSPKVISHKNGIRKSKGGKILEKENEPKKPKKSDYQDPVYGEGDAERKQYDEDLKLYKQQKAQWDADCKESFYEVDLRNKTVLFLESINPETFRMIKSTMSHDHDYIDHEWVDDKGKVHVTRLIGAPAIIFCTVDNGEYIDEQATRTLTATPSTRAEKIEDSMRISNRKSAYPWLYNQEPFHRRVIKEYVRSIKRFMAIGKIQVATPFDEDIIEGFSKDAVRDMRDFNKFLELLPSYAIFKLFKRPIVMIQGKRYLIPTIQDAINAKVAFDSIIETTKTSTDYRIIEFYNTTVIGTSGLTAEDLTDIYNKGKKRQITVKTIRKWLRRLEALDYVDIRGAKHENAKGYIDDRFNAYYPLKKNAPIESFSDKSADFESILKKAFEKWLKNTPFQTDVPPIILKIDGTAREITQEEMKKIILGESLFEGAFSTLKQTLKEESSPAYTFFSEESAKSTFSRYAEYSRISRKPGVLCSAIKQGCECGFEAEWSINGNLYCDSCFREQASFSRIMIQD